MMHQAKAHTPLAKAPYIQDEVDIDSANAIHAALPSQTLFSHEIDNCVKGAPKTPHSLIELWHLA